MFQTEGTASAKTSGGSEPVSFKEEKDGPCDGLGGWWTIWGERLGMVKDLLRDGFILSHRR